MTALSAGAGFGSSVVAALPDPVGSGFDQVQGWAHDLGDSLFARFASFLGDWALRSAAFSANLVWSHASQATAIDLESQRSTYGMVQSLSPLARLPAFSDAISALLGRYEPTGPGPQHQSLPTQVDSKPW